MIFNWNTTGHHKGAGLASAVALGLAIATAAATAAPPDSVPGKATGRPEFPQLSFPDRSRGQTAIGRLGSRLPEVAAWYGKTPSEFTTMLREDGTAWIDQRGMLLFIDPLPAPTGGEAAPAAAPFPLEETFTLHSRPGASRVIYLDFDGHVTTGTAWNTSVDPIVSPAYTRDTDPEFSDLELEYIQDMWRQVAEDYAPFDVDVTTEDPGDDAIFRDNSSDGQYGTRVVVTEDNFDNCGCGGFAYVGVYDYYSSTNPGKYKPAFVFNTGLVGAGEAISHEAGHNLGLSHDGPNYYEGHGSGDTGWAPIMGVGYYQPLVQWSKGEYSGANNTEDDIAIIQSNGAPLAADDHSNTAIGATPVAASGDGSSATISGGGIIERASDVDVFSLISGAGAFSIAIDAASYRPNLDILATLRDGSGTTLYSSNPETELSATLAGNLAAGEYFLHIEGTGKGDPGGTGYSDYGSLGEFTISGSVVDPSGLMPPIADARFAPPGYTPDYAGALVGFDGSFSTDPDSDGSGLSWAWDFGDGNSDTGEFSSHSYSQSGSFTVTLTVTDRDGLTGSDTLSVEVLNTAPVASIAATPSSGPAPLTVDFDGSASSDNDGSIAQYFWQFGNGESSSEVSPSHTYDSWGSVTASLTVTDNLGASHTATHLVSIDPPSELRQYASGENHVAGTVSGSLSNLTDADGVSQSIRERESGGKKRSRYSYLDHSWLIDVQPGDAMSLVLRGSASNSSDDQMQISYALPGQSFTGPVITLGNSIATHTLALPASTSGTVQVRVSDSDQSSGNRTLDYAYIDQLYIQTDFTGGTPPLTAPAFTGSDVTTDSVTLYWTDNSSGEDGFELQRSPDQSSWAALQNLAAGAAGHTDIGLAADTVYYYRLRAYNSETDSAWAYTSARTDAVAPPPGELTLSASGSKSKGYQQVDLDWSPATTVDIYRDDVAVATSVSGTHYLDQVGLRGGGSYRYQVCEAGTSSCSSEVSVVF